MGIADQVRVAIKRQASRGTFPATGSWLTLNVTGQSLKPNVGYTQSNTLTVGRQVADLIRNSLSAGGELPMEFQHVTGGEGLDLLLAETLQSPAEVAQQQTTSLTTSGTDKDVTGPGAETGVLPGDIIHLTGANVGYYVVASTATDTVTVEAPANLAADTGITLTRAPRYTNGANQGLPFGVEVASLDTGEEIFENYLDMLPGRFTLSAEAGQLLTCGFSFLGSRLDQVDGTSDIGSPSSAPGDPFLSSIDNLAMLRIAGDDYDATALNIELDDNFRERLILGQLGSLEPGAGRFEATGSITAYFDNTEPLTEYGKIVSDTNTSLAMVFVDGTSKGWSFSFPRVKYNDVDQSVSGPNTDRLLRLDWTAFRDGTSTTASDSGVTLVLQRWD